MQYSSEMLVRAKAQRYVIILINCIPQITLLIFKGYVIGATTYQQGIKNPRAKMRVKTRGAGNTNTNYFIAFWVSFKFLNPLIIRSNLRTS